jgi:hypothetical protein
MYPQLPGYGRRSSPNDAYQRLMAYQNAIMNSYGTVKPQYSGAPQGQVIENEQEQGGAGGFADGAKLLREGAESLQMQPQGALADSGAFTELAGESLAGVNPFAGEATGQFAGMTGETPFMNPADFAMEGLAESGIADVGAQAALEGVNAANVGTQAANIGAQTAAAGTEAAGLDAAIAGLQGAIGEFGATAAAGGALGTTGTAGTAAGAAAGAAGGASSGLGLAAMLSNPWTAALGAILALSL